MKEALRYRYALMPGGECRPFIDTFENRKALLEKNVKLFSTNVFSKPLESQCGDVTVWGDLYFPITLHTGSLVDFYKSARSVIKSILDRFAIPHDEAELNVMEDDALLLVIPQELFQGELGIINRQLVDSRLYTEIYRNWPKGILTSANIYRKVVNKVSLRFLPLSDSGYDFTEDGYLVDCDHFLRMGDLVGKQAGITRDYFVMTTLLAVRMHDATGQLEKFLKGKGDARSWTLINR